MLTKTWRNRLLFFFSLAALAITYVFSSKERKSLCLHRGVMLLHLLAFAVSNYLFLLQTTPNCAKSHADWYRLRTIHSQYAVLYGLGSSSNLMQTRVLYIPHFWRSCRTLHCIIITITQCFQPPSSSFA